MDIKYYCIATCDKCRLARKLLKSGGHNYSEVDMRRDGLDVDVLRGWIEAYGVERMINKKSATWRQADEAARAGDPIDLVMTNPAVLHRPILDFGDCIENGKAAIDWLEA